MMSTIIKKPVWYDRSISINKNLIDLAQKRHEALQVKIDCNPYKDFTYSIDPSKVLSIGKKWVIKGTELVNFKISEMEVMEGGEENGNRSK